MKTKLYFLLFFLVLGVRAQEALDLNGVSNYVDIPYTLSTTSFTIEYDMKLNTLKDYNTGITCTTGNIADPIDFYVFSSGGSTVWIGGSGSSQNFTGPNFSAGQWYHVAFVVTTTPSKNVKMLINGVEVLNQAFVYNLGSSSNLKIGDRADGVTNADAVFDNVRIWSVARTTQEILDNKSACLTGSETGLDVYYTFENVSGTSVEDFATGNGVDNGTISGSYSSVTGTGCTQVTSVPTTDYSTQVYTGNSKTLADLSVTGSSIQWYDASSAGNTLPSSTLLVDETTYYASQTVLGVESTNRLSITVNRISDDTQSLASGNTVAELIATPSTGTSSEWYTASSGGSALATSELLSVGTYYVQQAVSAGLQEVYSGSGITDVAVQSDGKIVWSESSGNIKRMDADGSNVTTLVSGLNNPYGIAIQTDGKILIAESYAYNLKRVDSDGSNMVTLFNQSGIFVWDVAVQSNGKIVFCTLNNVVYQMDSDGSNVTPIINVTGLSSPRGIAVQSDDKILIANYSSKKVVRTDSDGTNMVDFVTGYTPNRVAVRSNGKVLITDNAGAVKEYNSDGTGESNVLSTSLPQGIAEDSNGKVLVTKSGSVNRIQDASNSNRVAVSVNLTTTAPTVTYSLQVYTGDDKTLNDLSVSGSNIKWYDATTNGNLLVGSTSLVDETTYYASQTVQSIESSGRVAVKVNKIAENVQSLSSGSTIADLTTTPSTGSNAEWYADASGGTVLESTETLSTATYYVQQAVYAGLSTLYADNGGAPIDVAVQSDGKIVWSNTDGSIKRMDSDGSNVTTLRSTGLNNPYGIAIQSDGKILITDTYNNAVKRMDADGSNLVTLFFQSGIYPFDVDVQSDGKIVFCTINNTVYRMDSDGSNSSAIITTGLSSARGIAVQSDDKLLIANYSSSKVVRTDADGTNMVDLIIGFVPNKVNIQSDGKILVSDNTNGQIKRFNSDGTGVEVLASVTTPQGVAQDKDGEVIGVNANSGVKSIGRIVEASNTNRVAVSIEISQTLGNDLVDSEADIILETSYSSGLYPLFLKEKASAVVYDYMGKQIYSQQFNSSHVAVDIRDQASGVYILIIETKNKRITRKIIKN